MADDDWFRATRWTPEVEVEFETRLSAAQKSSRQQYLAIQAGVLLQQPDGASQGAGVKLAHRSLAEGDSRFDHDRVRAALGEYLDQQGRPMEAIEQLRLVHTSNGPGKVDEGESLRIASIILRERFENLFDEAEDRLDLVLASRRWLFRPVRVSYATARARLASLQGRPDEAAAFALGALQQIAEDLHQPLLSRHPDVGRTGRHTTLEDELRGYAENGNAEAVNPIVAEYRDPSSGEIQWRWPLVERLRDSLYDRRRAARDATREAAAPLLEDLRSVGAAVPGLEDVTSQLLSTKGTLEILVAWLRRADDPSVLYRLVTALTDKRARRLATNPMIAMFRDAELDPSLKARVAAAIGTLARDESFDQIAELLRNSRHGTDRAYLFWAVSYMKRPEAVDLCLEFIDDPELSGSALRALGDLRSVRAHPILQAIANEPTPPGRSGEAQDQRERVKLAQKGLAKLERAEASRKARP